MSLFLSIYFFKLQLDICLWQLFLYLYNYFNIIPFQDLGLSYFKTAKMKNALLILLMTVVYASLNPLWAQEKEIGLYTGYGPTGMKERDYSWDLDFEYRFRHNGPKIMVIGASYSDRIFMSRFHINTGINYFKRELYQSGRENYLNIPAGVEYLFGKKFKCGIGAGLYLNTRISAMHSKTMNSLILGRYIKASAGYQLNDKYRLMLSWTGNADITNMYKYISPGHTGAMITHEEMGFDSVFGFGIFYCFR